MHQEVLMGLQHQERHQERHQEQHQERRQEQHLEPHQERVEMHQGSLMETYQEGRMQKHQHQRKHLQKAAAGAVPVEMTPVHRVRATMMMLVAGWGILATVAETLIAGASETQWLLLHAQGWWKHRHTRTLSARTWTGQPERAALLGVLVPVEVREAVVETCAALMRLEVSEEARLWAGQIFAAPAPPAAHRSQWAA